MFDESRRLRLGVGGLGSIPGIALTVVAFVVLALIRQASLVLVPTNPDASTAKRKKKERPPMVTARSLTASSLETAWALGVSVLAGPPLLT